MSSSAKTLHSCTDSRPPLTLLTTLPGTRAWTSSRSHCTMSWPLLASSVGTLHAHSQDGTCLLSCTVIKYLWPSPSVLNVPADHCRHLNYITQTEHHCDV